MARTALRSCGPWWNSSSNETAADQAGPVVAKGPLIVGHFHHGLRPQQADADQAFVESLCQDLGVPCETGSADVRKIAAQQGDGLEAAARELRYDFLLRDLAERHGARYLVTGHTADDQAETILHRIVRGTGLRGLAGMPRARSLSPAVSLLRPLLTLSRSAVHAYLAAIEQPYCSDESNSDPAFTRNRIRNQLLPLIQEEFNPQAIPAILRLGQLAGDVQQTRGSTCRASANRLYRPRLCGMHLARLRPAPGRARLFNSRTADPNLARPGLAAAGDGSERMDIARCNGAMQNRCHHDPAG